MGLTKILITVKTYPSLSMKYDELVCTAGFLEDGRMIRLYPIPFRKLEYEKWYKKYQWVEIDIVKNTKDNRPESYRPRSIDSKINTLNFIGTENNGWDIRKSLVLKNVYTNLSDLIAESKNREINTSLAVFKPTNIIKFYWEKDSDIWSKNKIDAILTKRAQLKLFEEQEDDFSIVDKLPYKFKYEFEDSLGKKSNLMIEDWEVGALYWKMLEKRGNEEDALRDMKNKFFNFMKERDVYFYLGTSLKFHYRSINPFMIIGIFYPPKENQLALFD